MAIITVWLEDLSVVCYRRAWSMVEMVMPKKFIVEGEPSNGHKTYRVQWQYNKLNRSKRWDWADDYSAARELSPDPEQPVK